MIEKDLQQICGQFTYEGDYISAEPYGEGHINVTYLVVTTKKRYILQKLNRVVFKNTVELMENVAAVTEFLREKIEVTGGDANRETLTLIPAKDGKVYYETEQGDMYRMYLFVEDTTSYQLIDNPVVFYKVGKSFGRFQKMLADFPAAKLHEIILNFHNTKDRFRQFQEALAADVCNRAATAKEEIQFILDREKDTTVVLYAINQGRIPLRVTHNDTKLNNVLIDNKTGEGICVIDLDTVMPGSLLYDFGDSIRFGASTAAEDEQDLSKVSMDLNLFEQYTKGYLEELGASITEGEIELLAYSAKLMTLECGMRFLTDYLSGDTYFRIHRENHNLDRARTQLKLVKDMEEKMEQMQAIVRKYA